MRNYLLFRLPQFRSLFIARLISSVGDKFYTIALAWHVLDMDPEHGKSALALLMALNVLPVVLAGPLIGALTDRWDKRSCMIAADALRGGLIALLTVFLFTGNLTMTGIYVISFLQALCVPLFDAAAQSAIAPLTSKADLNKAVSLNGAVNQVAAVTGAFLGGLMLHWVGIAGAFLFNACSYFVAVYFLFRINTRLRSEQSTLAFWPQFKEGLAYMRSNRKIYSLLFLFALMNFFFAPLLLLLPILVKEDLGLPASALATLEGFLALGALAVTLYLSINPIQRSPYRFLCFACMSMGLAFLALSALQPIYLMGCCLLFVGISVSTANTVAMSLFQHTVPDGLKGRFFAVLYTLVYVTMPLSYSLVGMLLQHINAFDILLYCGTAMVVLSALTLRIPRMSMPAPQDSANLQNC